MSDTQSNQPAEDGRAHRAPGEPIEDWRKRRQAAAEALIGGVRPADDGLAGR